MIDILTYNDFLKIGENEVADEMYKIVFEYAEQDIESNEITEVCPHTSERHLR